MQRLTARRQSVTVMTVSTLHGYLENVSDAGRRFTISKVRPDRVWIRCDYTHDGKKKHSSVLLPAYPTGLQDDAPSNNLNVVLDPLEFEGVQCCAERDEFAPLLGDDILSHFERTHPAEAMPVSRCC